MDQNDQNNLNHRQMLLRLWSSLIRAVASVTRQIIHRVFQWDLNRTYPEPPVVLQGGYEAMGQTYPTMCNNLRAYISKKYQDFEELLDLDTIVYPQEPECDQALIGCNEQNLLYRKWCNFIEKLEKADDFCKELTSAYQTLLSGANSLEENSGKLTLEELKAKRAALTNLMNEIGAKLKNVYEKRDKLKTEADTCKSLISMERVTIKDSLGKRKMVKEDLEEPIVGDGNEMVVHQPDDGGDNFLELEDTTTTAATSTLKTVEEDAAEPLRKKAVLRAKILSVKPTIDRSMKPFPVIGALEHRNEGLVGLKNIKNTCYMNAVIQCIRHCPSISEFFCSGTFSTHRVKLNCAILSQMASLVRYMWTTCEKYVTPTSFYKRVTSLDPIFGQGLHEDATEFLLFLLNHLTEDCIYEADQHSTLTTTQKAWELHFQGKHSFFIDTFHHQIRNKQMCLKCMKPSYRFDTEPSVMVHTPTHDTDLLTLLDEYLADFIIPGKCCLICKGPMINKKDVTVTPEVLIIIVKRTIPPMRGSGHQAFAKSNHMVRFPRENLPFGKSKYKLISITLHSGDADFGHYRAYCLTQKGWAIFNDENSEIVTSENDSIAREAYIYFYTKM